MKRDEVRALRDILQIHRAALSTVRPETFLPAWFRWNGREWSVADQRLTRPLGVLAVGKAAPCMMKAAHERLGTFIDRGLVITKTGHSLSGLPYPQLEAAHPVPDERSLQAGEQALAFARTLPEEGTLLVLLSGGASALMEALHEGLTLQDLQETTRLMLGAGLSIHEINAVRKHLSRIKGGGLLRHTRARVITLAVSDVVGDDPSVIGSGPTVPDPSSCTDALEVLRRAGILHAVPPAVREALIRCRETLKPEDPACTRSAFFIAARNRDALQAAHHAARQLGYEVLVLTSLVDLSLDALGEFFREVVQELRVSGHPIPPPAVLLAGGEVRLRVEGPGLGGRNTHFAVHTAALFPPDAPVVVLGGSTDGTDGPTDAAGGVMVPRWKTALDPSPYLRDFDTYRYLARVGGLLRTGPTCTNVGDVYGVLVWAGNPSRFSPDSTGQDEARRGIEGSLPGVYNCAKPRKKGGKNVWRSRKRGSV